MSMLGRFYVPDEDILRELGRMQVLHSQLDHMLRLVIKRTLGISIDDAGHWNETRGMAKTPRQRARKLIDAKYRDDNDKAGTLNKVLDDPEDVTLHRNLALHSVWIERPGAEPVLQDRDDTSREHRSFHLPTVEDLQRIGDRIARIQRVLDDLTR